MVPLRPSVLVFLAGLLPALLAPVPAAAAELGDARLLVAGTRLAVSPESQTVPFDTPTIVETRLEGYEAARGALPAGLRVVGELTGPDVSGVLELETVPGEPFRIPRLSVGGEYRLENVRLVDGGTVLALAEPSDVSILVTRVLVTRVTSRALTLDEIRSRGLVVDGDSVRAYNFTFGFALDGEVLDYEVPLLVHHQRDRQSAPPVFLDDARPRPSSRFRPRVAPFVLTPRPSAADEEEQAKPETSPPLPPLPGALVFPTDTRLLNQFFSVVLLAQNGAPEGDRLVIRDLYATLRLPPGLRTARTEPPTPLGVPVPVRVPGPDGELGTGDDLTFLVGQASGEAEFSVEGLEEGTHVVSVDLEGILEGLPGGLERLTGEARGAVLVRDPTLNVVITHPAVVRTGEEYDLELAVSNTSNAPANLLTVTLPPERISGAEVVGTNQRTVATLLPGGSEVLRFRLRALRTGRVTGTAARSDRRIDPTFELTHGVGDAGIPLSPTTILLPRATEALPELLVDDALALVGLGFSLATAPPGAAGPDLPQVSRAAVDDRVFQLAQAGYRAGLGEHPFDTLAVLASEWTGAADRDWEWDAMRRATVAGGRMGDSLAAAFAAEAAAGSTAATVRRWADATAYLPAQAAVAAGGGVRLTVASRATGKLLAGAGVDPTRRRELPFADLLPTDDGAFALLAAPEEAGYAVRATSPEGGPLELHLVIPPAPSGEGAGGEDGAGRLLASWSGVVLSPGGSATVELVPGEANPVLLADTDGDGVLETSLPATATPLGRPPFTALAAAQDSEISPSGHVVDVLFSAPVDLHHLNRGGGVSSHFELPGIRATGADFVVELGPLDGHRDDRIVRVTFDNAVSPYLEHELVVRDVAAADGRTIGEARLPITTTVDTPGTLLAGSVIGPDGEPLPFARVDLYETDRSDFLGECITHKTGSRQADAAGRFRFDYVRQTRCGGTFALRATAPGVPGMGTARGRVRFIGETVNLDVVMLGRGTLRGRVTYDDDSVPSAGVDVLAYSPILKELVRGAIDEHGNYEVRDLPVGTIEVAATDASGSRAVATVEMPVSGATVTRDLVIVRRPAEATGELSGTVLSAGTDEPAVGAWVALYVDQRLHDVLTGDDDGRFDFGLVPAGTAEIEAFDAETGASGARLFFELHPDRRNEVTVRLRDERGTVEGRVLRRSAGGATPVAGAVVYLSGLPFHTTTAADGSYRLEGIVAGTRSVVAVDLERNDQVFESVTLTVEGEVVIRDLYLPDASLGTVAGEVVDGDGLPVPRAVVRLSTGVGKEREQLTGLDGRFRFDDVGIRTWEVHAVKGAAGVVRRASLTHPGDQAYVRLELRTGTLRGKVEAREEDGSRVPVAAVVSYRTTVVREDGLVGLDRKERHLETGADGVWELPGVLAGDYRLTIRNPFYGSRQVAGELVEPGEVLTHDVLFESTTGTISGVVYQVDGVTPAAGARLTLRHPRVAGLEVTADDDGRFAFELIAPHHDPMALDVYYAEGLVFRQGREWVCLTRPGQELDIVVVLPAQGAVGGQVVDASGEPAPGATVTLKESSYPRRTLTVEADGAGRFRFSNVFAGTATLAARSLDGRAGKSAVELAHEGQEIEDAVVALEPVGAIAGVVRSPVDGAAVASAEVLLFRGRRLFDSATSDDAGEFRFAVLPRGTYEVRALDPRTGRQGLTRDLVVDFEGQEVATEVVLEERGAVDGRVYEADRVGTIAGATVTLYSQGIVAFRTHASSGPDGAFEFPGVPRGPFTLSTREPHGRRRARGSGEVVAEGERLTVDLVLEAGATVTGTILHPGTGAPAENVSLRIFQGSELVGATLDNPYRVEGLLSDHSFRVLAAEQGGPRRLDVLRPPPADGTETTLDLTLVPVAPVAVEVWSGSGQPVAGASVRLVSRGPNGTTVYFGSAGADGRARFPEVQGGALTAYATDPATDLGGTAEAALETDGAELALPVFLEAAGTLRGRIVGPDGEPRPDGVHLLLRSRYRELRGLAGADGWFEVPLPLDAYTVYFEEVAGPGIQRAGAELVFQGERVDLGTLVLDPTPPRVVAVSPAADSAGVPLDAAITVTFSEPMVPALGAAETSLRHLDAARSKFQVPVDASWSADATAITLVPRQPLESFKSYRLHVSAGHRDPAGHPLPYPVQVTFTTADTVPPEVVETYPAAGDQHVPEGAQLRLVFSEPIAEASLSGTALQLTDTTTGTGVGTTYSVLPGAREVYVTPVGGMAPESAHRLVVDGVADRAGNPLAEPFVLEFATADVEPPAIVSVAPPEGTEVRAGEPVRLAVEATDRRGIDRVVLRFGGRRAELAAPPWEAELVAPAVELPTEVVASAEVWDPAGNATLAEWPLRVLPGTDPGRPEVAIACPSPGARLAPGTGVDVVVEASDDGGVDRVEIFLDDDPEPAAVLFDAPYRWRLDVPAGAADGDVIELRAVARDFAGRRTEARVAVPVTAGEVVVSDTVLAAHDPTFDGRTVYVDGARLELHGPQRFRDLVVLGGGVVGTRAPESDALPHALDLVLERDLWVACGGTIDVSERGFLPGRGNPDAPLDPAAGATRAAGGSHGGRGGRYDGSSPVTQPVADPVQAGPGGGAAFGGGAVRIAAAGRATVDGRIEADGGADTVWSYGGGSGGAVRIEAGEAIGGSGVLSAAGGGDGRGGGGGGRIALLAPAVGERLVERAAAPGSPGGGGAADAGAAGTVFARSRDWPLGLLVVDAHGLASDHPLALTELPSVGRGTVSAATGASLTDDAADFVDLVGLWVALDDRPEVAWRIESHERHGTALELAADPAAAPEAVADGFPGAPGDRYHGVQRYDRVVVRGGARVSALDRLDAAEVVVEPGSWLGTDHDEPPLLELEVPERIASLERLEARLGATSPHHLLDLELAFSGRVVEHGRQLVPQAGTTGSLAISATVPPTAEPAEVVVEARATDARGLVAHRTAVVTVEPDGTAPTVKPLSPAPGSRWTATDPVTVAATVADDLGIDRVTLALGGESVTLDAPPWEWPTAVPQVGAATAMEVSAIAVDLAGNVGEARWTIEVEPVADADPPALALVCPGDGAFLAPGTGLDLHVEASDDNGVDRVELWVGEAAAPAAVATAPPYRLRLEAAPDAAPGTVLDARVAAVDTTGATSWTSLAVPVVEATVVAADTLLGAGDATLDGRSLVVAGGAVLTVDGPHAFGSLAILDGAVLTHPANSATSDRRIELALDGDLFVACGGAVDVLGRGRPGAGGDQRGGAHGGCGGGTGCDPGPHGSLYDPRRSGGGGSASSMNAGGGVVRIAATGRITVDGAVDARGATAPAGQGAGAGGAVRLDGAAIGGRGRIDASGGDGSANTRYYTASGGGGRVALYGATVEDGLLARTLAPGGYTYYFDYRGGPGTVYVRRGGQELGELRIDNGGTTNAAETHLPPVGFGVVDAVGERSITDLEAVFAADLTGAWVAFDDDRTRLWRIAGHAPGGDTLELDTAASPLTARVGDTYSGAWRFDRLVVSGAARVVAGSPILAPAAPEVAPGATLDAGNFDRPTIDAARLGFTAESLLGPGVVGAAGAVADPQMPARVTVENLATGEVTTVATAPDGSFVAAVSAHPGDVYRVRAEDGHPYPLPSDPATTAPAPADLPATVRLALGHVPAHLAADGGLVAAITDPAAAGTAGPHLVLVDLADPEAPALAAELLLPVGPAPIEDLALEAGVVAVAQSQAVHVVDARDPYQPVFDPAEQSLRLIVSSPSSVTLGQVSIERGVLQGLARVGTSSGYEYAIVDVRDPRAPVRIAAGHLSSPGPGVREMRIEEGEVLVASATGNARRDELTRFDAGDPAAPLRRQRIDSAPGPSAAAGVAVVGDVLVYPRLDGTVSTAHRYQSGVARRETPVFVGSADHLVHVGDRLLVASREEPELVVGSTSRGIDDHGFAIAGRHPAPVVPRADGGPAGFTAVVPAGGRLWTLAGDLLAGHPAPALAPWLEPARIAARPEAGGATVVGAPGAVYGDGGGTTVEAAGRTGSASAPVAGDGSFELFLPGAAPGEALTVATRDAAGTPGARLTVRSAPSGAPLALAGGAARLRLDRVPGSGLAAAFGGPFADPALVHLVRLPGAGAAAARLAGVATSDLAAAGTPVADALVHDGVLYLAAGATLAVYDLADPAAPALAATLAPFGAEPVQALAAGGGVLWALGPDGAAGSRLAALGLEDPLAPAARPDEGGPVDAAFDGARLELLDGELFAWDRRSLRVLVSGAGAPPAPVAAGSYNTLRDVERVDGRLWAAFGTFGIRELDLAGGAVAVLPERGEPRFAAAVLPAAGPGDGPWWAGGRGGVRALLALDALPVDGPAPVHAVLPTAATVHEGVAVGSTLYLATDDGLLALDLDPR